LLLGLLCADRASLQSLPGRFDAVADIRAEIESRLNRAERVTTSVDGPLSPDSSKALEFAAESADRLTHPKVDILHRLVGLLRVEGSVAAQILMARALEAGPLLARIREPPESQVYMKATSGAILTLSVVRPAGAQC
jgi:ATP-dependent Clp protease ATP-binding subunit ClpA